MKYLLSIAIASSFFVFGVQEVHAIVVIPALILVPIAKILAVLLAGLSLPTAFIGWITAYITKTSWKKTVFIGFCILFVTVFIVGVVLKVTNPERAFF